VSKYKKCTRTCRWNYIITNKKWGFIMPNNISIVKNSLNSKCKSHQNIKKNSNLLKLFFVWFKIGSISFGGGAVTQYLIQENFIYKYKWLTEEEYSNILAMSQITPGMGIIAFNILLGKLLGGYLGALISLLGLIIPSAGITVIITAIYSSISEFPYVQRMLHTVFAAIFGIGIVTNWRNAKTIIVKNQKKGLSSLIHVIGIMFFSAIIYLFLKPPVFILYILGGICGSVSYWYISRKQQEVS